VIEILYQDIKDRKRDVVLVAGEVQVVDETIDFGIPDLSLLEDWNCNGGLCGMFTFDRSMKASNHSANIHGRMRRSRCRTIFFSRTGSSTCV